MPIGYWSELKIQLAEKDGFSQLYEKIVRLKLQAPDKKMRETDTTNTETLFRIIQSIPSPKAEPFKRWLAQVGYDRVNEIEDPELATQGTINHPLSNKFGSHCCKTSNFDIQEIRNTSQSCKKQALLRSLTFYSTEKDSSSFKNRISSD